VDINPAFKIQKRKLQAFCRAIANANKSNKSEEDKQKYFQYLLGDLCF